MKPALLCFYAEEAGAQAALDEARARDLNVLEVYSPYEVDTGSPPSSAQLGRERRVVRCGLVGGLAAFLGVYALEWWARDVAYVLHVGGRVEHPWPAFVLPAIEAAMFAVGAVGLRAFCREAGLPFLSAPLLAAPGFNHVSQTGFALAFDADDIDAVREFAKQTGAHGVAEAQT